MLLKTGLKKYKCNVGTNSMFFPVGEYLLTVTGRMYSPQKRTIKHRSLGLPVIKWLDFPIKEGDGTPVEQYPIVLPYNWYNVVSIELDALPLSKTADLYTREYVLIVMLTVAEVD